MISEDEDFSSDNFSIVQNQDDLANLRIAATTAANALKCMI